MRHLLLSIQSFGRADIYQVTSTLLASLLHLSPLHVAEHAKHINRFPGGPFGPLDQILTYQ